MSKIQKAKYLVRNTASIINNYYHILLNILKSHVTSVSLNLTLQGGGGGGGVTHVKCRVHKSIYHVIA